ncbi:5-oxoprolinase subunit A OS=Streptomyces tendae OX=1932 GN=pxpA PE=3 SV=1 [Streptomyces tendae]
MNSLVLAGGRTGSVLSDRSTIVYFQGVIDLNADLGEGFGRWTLTDDDALLSVVTSANVACGFHAGDPAVMRRVCDLAAERGVRIGAQVSYRDLAGFGRRAMDVPSDELAAEVAYQIGALSGVRRSSPGPGVAYAEPYGALYNRTVHDDEQARAVVAGVRLAGGALPVLGLPGSRLLTAAADAGLHRRPGGSSPTAPTPRRAPWSPAVRRARW